ncbi:hypothetical protein GCM10023084_17680 [Streptomyces lacrimifluminis]|uniref:Uncharacterized protein n=1 Tax=Streptomyces lacrimifluminis TaxID=1500077 RepID=A0A917KCJ6_9ACTN|nr:hypothetical protein GCM10012282_02050 [Streptomyces lacrimifluminis]
MIASGGCHGLLAANGRGCTGGGLGRGGAPQALEADGEGGGGEDARGDGGDEQQCPAAKTPPYETVRVLPKVMVRAPVTAPPAMEAGITRKGAASANGMALSGTKARPNSQATFP